MSHVHEGYTVKEMQVILEDTWDLDLLSQFREIIHELIDEFDDIFTNTEIKIIFHMLNERENKITRWLSHIN